MNNYVPYTYPPLKKNVLNVISAVHLKALAEVLAWTFSFGDIECPFCNHLYPDHEQDCSYYILEQLLNK